MEWLQFLPLIVLLIGGLILLLFYVLIRFLRKKDMEIDYSNKQIQYYIQNENGTDYLLVPYLFWQNGKLNTIKELFSDELEFENKFYKIELLYTHQHHLKQAADLFPKSFYRDCKSVIKRIDPVPINYGNISNTYVSGNNNQISVDQKNYSNIKTEIENFIQAEANLSDNERELLESFLYQLSKSTVKNSTAKKVVDILSKSVLPAATSIINLIIALFF